MAGESGYGCGARLESSCYQLGRVWGRRAPEPYPWATWCNLFPTRQARWLGAGRDKHVNVADR
ncbi:hypothetical protein PCL1606_05230 [Pseudomonas chlororaphis]|uniref:Uncharacterized protein n=1 Tax=Pseudomonas chlororaphis TaxID=587753 RepID=A0A0D5XSC2_9PSED|nr:hypothetical protein PCL1606_05230 [Pseudomonas chlororaphis]